MLFLPLILTVLFGFFSTAIMGYISMATPIGPWIAPTVVLGAFLMLKAIAYKKQSDALAFITTGASIGGIVATACGFSYPTLYFLDPDLFMSWMAQPRYFVGVLSGLAFVAGLFGILVANLFEYSLIVEQQLSFPIGQLIYKMIIAGNQIKKALKLIIGFLGTIVFCIMQNGIGIFPGFIPHSISLLPSTTISIFNIPRLTFDLWPMLWAIGFVTGHVIAWPLAVGAIIKVGLIDPMQFFWFSSLSPIEFVLAFCSGMVLYGAIISFVSLPALLKKGMQWITTNKNSLSRVKIQSIDDIIRSIAWILTISGGAIFLRYFQFSVTSIIFLYISAFACMYQVALIAGKFGLAPLGRFATFVMVPAMLLFQLNMVQVVLVATFVEICCGVIADVLFGRKMAYLMRVDWRLVCLYQVFGLVISCLSVGIIFWLFINYFQLGSPELLAYKAQSRQLLIYARQFDVYVLMLGALCSLLLKFLKANPMFVLGGILMPLNISIGLIFGGLLTFLFKNREEEEPFWSGVFAANSLWMLVQAILG